MKKKRIFSRLNSRFQLFVNRVRFLLFFKVRPNEDEFCNSKYIKLVKSLSVKPTRQFLVLIRCGDEHELIDDGVERVFDIAISAYASPSQKTCDECEYLISGGINKYKTAYQFIDQAILSHYDGFIFLDDDLKISYSEMNGFLECCFSNAFELAQPSLSHDSHISHKHLLHKPDSGWRQVDMVEVMCPYFSRSFLRRSLKTFNLSYSTWGLDYVWPKLLHERPVVIDRFIINHTKPIADDTGPFYRYMMSIGASPRRELKKLRKMPVRRFTS